MREVDYAGQTYGRYRVLELLGEGAMGRVFLSEDPILKRKVAVKVIATDKHADQKVLEEFLERFRLEAQACAGLNHPSIVAVYDAGEEADVPWIAFEYVDGEGLDKVLKREKYLCWQKAITIAQDIVSAMIYAHEMGIVHRDIKPANILIDSRTGIAKLADFGVVKFPTSMLTQDGSTLGSPGYMSPEQIEGTQTDNRSDIFSFGIVLYEMLAGQHPFLKDSIPATFYATLNGTYKPASEIRKDIPPFLEKIVTKTLISDRDKRIQSAKEILSTLEGSRKTDKIPVQKESNYFLMILISFSRTFFKYALKSVSFLLEALEIAFVAVVRIIWRGIDLVVAFLCRRLSTLFSFIFSKRRLKVTFMVCSSALLALSLFFSVHSIRNSVRNYNHLREIAAQSGFTAAHPRHLVDSCKAFLYRGDLENATKLAGILLNHNRSNTSAQVILGIVAMKRDNFREATLAFSQLEKKESAKKAIRKEHPFLLDELRSRMERELPPPLVELAAHSLQLADHPQIRSWTEDEHFWVRWNAVRILQNAGKRVDLVSVYILDLTHSASTSTKVRAAQMLGELGDVRAVPALQKAAKRGPASRAAKGVLREKFEVQEFDDL